MSEGKELAVSEGSGVLATMEHPPDAVLVEAKRAAEALQRVIAGKPKKVMMGGEQYLEFEDWQVLGRFYGLTAGEEGEPEFVDLGGVKGFKATAVALFRGNVISRATAYCLNDEEKWRSRTKYEFHMALKKGGTAREEESNKNDWEWESNPNKPGGKRPKRVRVNVGEEPVPLFQLSSMAQTRANAKVLRNVLSWVVVLAGYRPTPAEELDADVVDAEVSEAESEKKTSGKKTPPREPEAVEGESPEGRPETCPHENCGGTEFGEATDGAVFCRKCRRPI